MNDPCEGKYDIVPRLRDHTNRDDNDIAEAATYIERLRAERDGARAEVCLLRTGPSAVTDTVTQSMADYAEERGWKDLFREDA